MSIFTAKCKTINQYLRVHWQKIAQQAWEIAQTWQFDNILSEPSMRMTCSFSHFTTGEKRQVVFSMFKKLPRWETDNLFRCYEKSIIDQEILKMRRTKEWEETKQSILSAKELVRFLYFSLMFFSLMRAYYWSFSYMKKKHCHIWRNNRWRCPNGSHTARSGALWCKVNFITCLLQNSFSQGRLLIVKCCIN